MIMLREDITGKRERAFDGSIMERAIRSELGPLPRRLRRAAPRDRGRRQPAGPAELGTRTGDAVAAGAAPMPPRPDWPTFSRHSRMSRPARTVGTATPGTTNNDVTQPDENPGPVSAAPVRGTTEGVPQISANPKFWQADHPAGFDDPAWRQTVPFVDV